VLDVPPEEIDPNQASLFGGEYRKRPQLEMPSLPPFSAPPPQNPAQALAALREEVGACTRCPRMAGRTHLIFGEGNVSASLLLLCDTPGSEDDRVGRAFQGEAGGLLARILETMLQLKPEDVFLTHLVMCHAPGGREASPEEISTCWTLLEMQVAVVRPQLIVTLGPQSARALLRTGQPLHRLRGHWFEQWGIPVLPTFAPQLLLQAPEHKRSVRDDMRQVAARLESLRSGHRG
jgi:DNA polymerase